MIDWIKKNLSWPKEATGTFVSGGTHGNLSALACARDNAKNKWKMQGKYPNGRPYSGYKLIISKDTHSSVRTIAKVLDVEVLTAETDQNGSMTGESVEKLIRENEGVFAVVATTGTTNTGSIDHIEDIANVCEKYNIWMHIDGAYGGAGILAASVKHLYKGIERADSFIVDPHKWFCLLYTSDAADE